MVRKEVIYAIVLILLGLFATWRLYSLYKGRGLSIAAIFDLFLETVVLAFLFRLIENIIWR